MRREAHVKSIEALEGFRAVLYLFGDDVGQALDSIQSEIQDFVEWLEVEQIKFWRAEIRNRENKVAEAKADLHRCLSATIDPHRTPTCYQEEKILDAAKKRLNEAEDKLATGAAGSPSCAGRHRISHEGRAPRSAVSSDLPVAAASLASSVNRLHEYLSIAPPSGDVGETPAEITRPAAARLAAGRRRRGSRARAAIGESRRSSARRSCVRTGGARRSFPPDESAPGEVASHEGPP